jgi:hypothetical protein
VASGRLSPKVAVRRVPTEPMGALIGTNAQCRPRRCPSSEVKRKTSTRDEYFAFWHFSDLRRCPV